MGLIAFGPSSGANALRSAPVPSTRTTGTASTAGPPSAKRDAVGSQLTASGRPKGRPKG